MIEQGYVSSINTRLVDVIPGKYNFDRNLWSDVSLKDILTMSIGLEWDEIEHSNIWYISDDVVQSTLKQSFKFKSGEKWEYRNPNVDLLAPVIINSAGMTVQAFADQYLFSKLDIKNYSWPDFKNTGYPLLDGSLALTPREMAKIGQLVLNKGTWKGNRIVSEEWIYKSTSPCFKVNNIFDYSYFRWLGKSSAKKGLSCIMAYGLGGQLIVIIPSLDMVVVTTGGNYEDMMSSGLLNLIDNYIIKSVLN